MMLDSSCEKTNRVELKLRPEKNAFAGYVCRGKKKKKLTEATTQTQCVNEKEGTRSY